MLFKDMLSDKIHSRRLWGKYSGESDVDSKDATILKECLLACHPKT